MQSCGTWGANTRTDKLRAVAASDGTAILAWDDARTDPNDVYVQNVELDGSLGIAPAAATPYGCGYNPAGSLLAVGSTPSIGTTFTVGVTDPAASMASGSSSVLVVAIAPAPGFPCGIPLGGTGMSAPGAVGELLVDLGTLVLPILSGPPWTAPASPSTFPFPLPAAPFLIGVTVEMQGALIEAGGRIGLSNGLHVRIGP